MVHSTDGCATFELCGQSKKKLDPLQTFIYFLSNHFITTIYHHLSFTKKKKLLGVLHFPSILTQDLIYETYTDHLITLFHK